MTKLTQFLTAAFAFLAVWSIMLKLAGSSLLKTYVLIPLPLHLIILFGIYSAATVLYRTVNFNDCPEAAKELQLQIDEARRDLRSKGLKF